MRRATGRACRPCQRWRYSPGNITPPFRKPAVRRRWLPVVLQMPLGSGHIRGRVTWRRTSGQLEQAERRSDGQFPRGSVSDGFEPSSVCCDRLGALVETLPGEHSAVDRGEARSVRARHGKPIRIRVGVHQRLPGRSRMVLQEWNAGDGHQLHQMERDDRSEAVSTGSSTGFKRRSGYFYCGRFVYIIGGRYYDRIIYIESKRI